MEPHYMDWQHQPAPYKRYPGIPTVELFEITSFYQKKLWDIFDSSEIETPATDLNMESLSKILVLANGLTGKSRQGGMDFYYRSAPSAGALYPNEIYLAWPGRGSLADGIYHYGVYNRSLTRLRQGNYLPVIHSWDEDMLPDPSSGLTAVFIISGVFFRSAWKYRKRAYRYVLMDGGHVIEGLRLGLSAADFPCHLKYTFDDDRINQLLGFDTKREVSLGCVCVYGKKTVAEKQELSIPSLPEPILSASKTSEQEVSYPEILNVHQAGRKIIRQSASEEEMISHLGVSVDKWQSINPGDPSGPAVLDYVKTVFKRRSRRNFINAPVNRNHLDFILNLICKATNLPQRKFPDYSSSVCFGFLAGNIEGLDPGFYLLDPKKRQFGMVFKGNLIQEMAAVCLDQGWLANAGVHFLCMTNLDTIERQWGSRGYRYAMMTAGRLGHVVYLGAVAMGLGCCGIGAFYDNEAKDLLRLNHNSALLYLVSVGVVRNPG
jgi:SagB-type dehydrogenase family enzyme